MTWSISAAGPSLSRPPHQSSSRLYSCSRLSSTLHTWNIPRAQQFSYPVITRRNTVSKSLWTKTKFRPKYFRLLAMAWRVTGYEAGPGQNDLLVIRAHSDLYCLGCNSSGLGVINPSSFLQEKGGNLKRLNRGRGQSGPSGSFRTQSLGLFKSHQVKELSAHLKKNTRWNAFLEQVWSWN